ncbi:DUF7382 domain-containing protein [Halopiger goleimassiliensis]|uniref:DUF7382 domain-containing protein n=1 Tax=Halopiger goleimassiliensis TaxID=1293048 RepID=UPI0009DBDDCC|nr:hypothetical protein [Halopiger goleimassiliensis]
MGSKQRTKPTVSVSTPDRSFLEDDRAIEGLPIRLVIALVIGVASLGIMLQILGGVDTFEGDTEVDVRFNDSSIGPDEDDVSVYVIDEDGNEVEDAVVVAEPASNARMDGALDQTTGDNSWEDNEVQFDFDDQGDLELPPDQSTGEIKFDIYPPEDSNWADDEPNNRLLVVE